MVPLTPWRVADPARLGRRRRRPGWWSVSQPGRPGQPWGHRGPLV